MIKSDLLFPDLHLDQCNQYCFLFLDHYETLLGLRSELFFVCLLVCCIASRTSGLLDIRVLPIFGLTLIVFLTPNSATEFSAKCFVYSNVKVHTNAPPEYPVERLSIRVGLERLL